MNKDTTYEAWSKMLDDVEHKLIANVNTASASWQEPMHIGTPNLVPNTTPYTIQPIFMPYIAPVTASTIQITPQTVKDIPLEALLELPNRVAELELKVTQLLVILNYMTGAKQIDTEQNDDPVQEGQ